jgi:hypothetical protein
MMGNHASAYIRKCGDELFRDSLSKRQGAINENKGNKQISWCSWGKG